MMLETPVLTCVGAAIVEDHVFPDIAAYKSYIATLRSQRVDFYVLCVGPGLTFRIAFPFDTIRMLDTPALRNVDPFKGVSK